MLRRTAERASRRFVFRRKLPSDLLSLGIWVTPAASLRYWFPGVGRVDPMLLETARALVRPGMTVWDIGANVGLFSFAAAALAGSSGSVLAFEPDPSLTALLDRSCRDLPPTAAPVSVEEVAVSDRVGATELLISTRSPSLNQLRGGRTKHTDDLFRSRMVRSVTLDSWMDRSPAPDLIKIDVEGLEAAVLRGAGKLLSEMCPIVVCETLPPESLQVTDILHENGYALFDGTDPRHLLRSDEASWLTIAVREVRELELEGESGPSQARREGQPRIRG